MAQPKKGMMIEIATTKNHNDKDWKQYSTYTDYSILFPTVPEKRHKNDLISAGDSISLRFGIIHANIRASVFHNHVMLYFKWKSGTMTLTFDIALDHDLEHIYEIWLVTWSSSNWSRDMLLTCHVLWFIQSHAPALLSLLANFFLKQNIHDIKACSPKQCLSMCN